MVGGEGDGEVLFDPILDGAGEDCGLALIVVDGCGPDFEFDGFADPVGDRIHRGEAEEGGGGAEVLGRLEEIVGFG